MIRSIFLAAALVLSQTLFAQEVVNEKPPLSERLFIGGSFGLQFGTVTNIQVAPVLGVWLLPRMNVAAGPSFQYYKDSYGSTLIYGGRAYSEFVFVQDLNNVIPLGVNLGLFIHTEYEGLSLEKNFFVADGASGRVFQGTFFGGLGISEPLGRRSSIDIELLWVLSGNKCQTHDSPEFRVMLNF
ncbi:MAG TPA: hypothetical protein PKM69_07270 [Bacteroidales bacterium]|nr:hypothetical protein [Bacteroidales bacterium]